MHYFLTPQSVLKWLEQPVIYHVAKDELYELDSESFGFFRKCASRDGCASKDGAFIDYCLDEGLITPEPVASRRSEVRKAPEPSLRYLELQITNACNLRCKHCYLDPGERQELAPETVRRVLSEFEDLQGLRVLITGGEPLLHSRFAAINDILADYSLRTVLFTNGTLLSRSMIRELKTHEIQVSIDGLEKSHDALRGAGSFEKTLSAARLALDAGLEVSVSTMVHAGNLGEFDDLEQLCKSMGAKDWTVDIPCAAGRMGRHQELFVSPEEGGKYLGYGYGGGMHATGQGYACGLHLMAVLPNGRAAKCTFYGERPVGTIDEGLKTCWERIKPIGLDRLACDCEFREACRGGCRYRAEIFGDSLGRDPYRCALYGILEQ